MPDLKKVRTSLEVGFTTGVLPEKFLRYRGRATRSIGLCAEFPYEDAQFQVVIMEGGALTAESAKEAHRVMRPEGWLFFEVDEKSSAKPEGRTLPELFSILKDGFNIVVVERSSWWRRWRKGGRITVSAQKKRWRTTMTFKGRDA